MCCYLSYRICFNPSWSSFHNNWLYSYRIIFNIRYSKCDGSTLTFVDKKYLRISILNDEMKIYFKLNIWHRQSILISFQLWLGHIDNSVSIALQTNYELNQAMNSYRFCFSKLKWNFVKSWARVLDIVSAQQYMTFW